MISYDGSSSLMGLCSRKKSQCFAHSKWLLCVASSVMAWVAWLCGFCSLTTGENCLHHFEMALFTSNLTMLAIVRGVHFVNSQHEFPCTTCIMYVCLLLGILHDLRQWPITGSFMTDALQVLHSHKQGRSSTTETLLQPFNTLRLRQNGGHFAEDILKCIFLNENVWISIKIPLKFVHNVSINNIPALLQIMAWVWPGKEP